MDDLNNLVENLLNASNCYYTMDMAIFYDGEFADVARRYGVTG